MFGRVSFLVDENAQALHFFISAFLQLLDRFGSLYGELARFVLRLLGYRAPKEQPKLEQGPQQQQQGGPQQQQLTAPGASAADSWSAELTGGTPGPYGGAAAATGPYGAAAGPYGGTSGALGPYGGASVAPGGWDGMWGGQRRW